MVVWDADRGSDCGTPPSPNTSVPHLFSDHIVGSNVDRTGLLGTRSFFERHHTGIFCMVLINPSIGTDLLLAFDLLRVLFVLPMLLAD